jgi:hypothetical protein
VGPDEPLPAITPPPAIAPPPARPAIVAPLAPQRYKVQFTASVEMYRKLRNAHGRCTERGFLEFHHVVPQLELARQIG